MNQRNNLPGTWDFLDKVIAIILLYSLVLFNYWLSYKLFTCMQVIGRKWVNIPE